PAGVLAPRRAVDAGGYDHVQATVEERPLVGEATRECFMVEGEPAQRLVTVGSTTHALQVAFDVRRDDAHEHLEWVVQAVQEAAVAGKDGLLLRLGLEGEVRASGLQDRATLAATEHDGIADHIRERET